MHSSTLLALTSVVLPQLAAAAAEEQVLGVFIFHRHGDRTAKDWKPVNFTALGAQEVYSSGTFYRNRYLDSSSDSSPLKIRGISSDVALPAQLSVTAPDDTVLQDSAITFVQGLYPPSNRSETLANGTTVEAPLGGYQYVPVSAVSSFSGSKSAESSEWLQGTSGCTNAEASSNQYLSSPEYQQTYEDSLDFYKSLLPVINGTYNESTANFESGYTIFDLINVAEIHNTSIPSNSTLTPSVLSRLYDLASTHEWNLAFNATEPVRAMAGQVLARQIVDSLQDIVDGQASATKFNIQFGAYGTFMSFFGLAQLPAASPDFYGICDYASSMAFELVTNSSSSSSDVKADDVSVRFYFSNGTTSQNDLKTFPLFGQQSTTLPWADFQKSMNGIAVDGLEGWCKACGNNDGECSAVNRGSTSSSSDNNSGSGGISNAVAGVIGALVTLAVILGAEALVMMVAGLRLVKKSTLRRAVGGPAEVSQGASKI